MNDLDLMQKDRFEDGENVFNFVIRNIIFNKRSDIRLKKRNNKKTITSVDGIPEEFDFNKILRYWKKVEWFRKIKEFQLHRNGRGSIGRGIRDPYINCVAHWGSQKRNSKVLSRRGDLP